MELLKELQAQMGDQVQFLFFTADDTHDEVTTLLRKRDFASCVLRRLGKGNLFQAIELALDRRACAEALEATFYRRVVCPFGTLFLALRGSLLL